MTDYKPANSEDFQEYFHSEADARGVKVQLEASQPGNKFIVVKTNKRPEHPYEIYYREDKVQKQKRRNLIARLNR